MAKRAEICSAFEGCCMPLALLLVGPSGPGRKLSRVGSRGWSENAAGAVLTVKYIYITSRNIQAEKKQIYS